MMENNYTSKVFSELSKIIPNDFLAYEFFLEVSRSQYHELWNTCFVKAAMIRGNSSIDIRTNNSMTNVIMSPSPVSDADWEEQAAITMQKNYEGQ